MQKDHLAALAQEFRLPSVYPVREHVVAGGLASYGPNLLGNVRASARHVAAILKGAKPGIAFSSGVLCRAHEVLE